MKYAITIFAAMGLACATNVYKPNEAVVAKDGEAIGAISFRTTMYANAVVFLAADGSQLKIAHGTTGTSTHLIHAAPGVYCLSSIHTSSVVLGMGNHPCIELAAGQNRYFGRIDLDDKWDVTASSDYQSAADALQKDFSGQDLALVAHGFYQAS